MREDHGGADGFPTHGALLEHLGPQWRGGLGHQPDELTTDRVLRGGRRAPARVHPGTPFPRGSLKPFAARPALVGPAEKYQPS